jgi:hypothetical protein
VSREKFLVYKEIILAKKELESEPGSICPETESSKTATPVTGAFSLTSFRRLALEETREL